MLISGSLNFRYYFQAHFTKTRARSRSASEPAKKRQRVQSLSMSRARSSSRPARDEMGVKDVVVSGNKKKRADSSNRSNIIISVSRIDIYLFFPPLADEDEVEEHRAQGHQQEGRQEGSQGRGRSFHWYEDAAASVRRKAWSW